MKKQSCFVSLLMLLLLFPLGAFAQQQMIKGQVVDDSGESIIGATIMVKGAKEGTLTDFDGNFSLKGKVGTTLSISYVGYSPLEVKVKKLEGNRFVLREDTKVLDEVVVVGMDKQKRSTITAAVATVSSEAIASRPVTDLTSALQGKVAGLNFSTDAVADGVGGEMGAEIKFNIRGTGSINKGEPYVLIDGVEQSLQNVNPNDIETISILKDASAAAVYGARAAYGVIIVTTKSGGKDKTRVSYNGTVGFSSPINMPKMMNSLEFAHYINERNDNDGKKHEISDALIEKMEGFMKNPYSTEFPGIEPNQNKTNWASSKDAVYANTDWFDYYFKDKELLGDNLDELSLVAPKVGDVWGDGVIFAVGEVTGYDEASNSFVTNVGGVNAYRGRIVANASLGMKLWCEVKAKGKASSIGASSRYDGLENLKIVEAFACDNGETLDLYPAFKVCKDLGEDWYFPALNEIRWIVLHKEELGLEMGSLSYGSSTEISVKDNGGVTNSGSDSSFDKAMMNIWPVCAY